MEPLTPPESGSWIGSSRYRDYEQQSLPPGTRRVRLPWQMSSKTWSCKVLGPKLFMKRGTQEQPSWTFMKWEDQTISPAARLQPLQDARCVAGIFFVRQKVLGRIFGSSEAGSKGHPYGLVLCSHHAGHHQKFSLCQSRVPESLEVAKIKELPTEGGAMLCLDKSG